MFIQLKSKQDQEHYLSQIAAVHRTAYSNKHLTSIFSKDKLEQYYEHLIDYSNVTTVSIDKNGKVNGFIISGYSVGKGINRFINKNKLYILNILLRKPSFLYEKTTLVLKSKLFKSKPNSEIKKYRLLSIAVDSSYHSKGIGSSLLTNFESILKEKKIDTYGLSVRKNNKKAIKFYLKHGFYIEKETKDSIYLGKDIL